MKKIFTLYCLSFVMTFSYAQNIAISENAQWVIEYGSIIPPGPADIYYTFYKTNGDTVINTQNYKKLYKMPVWQNGSMSYYSVGPMSYGYAFRNDGNNRAYIFPSNDTIEHLWYDFNLNIGDTLSEVNPWYSYSPTFYTDTIKVISIDSVYYCSKYYKRFNFNSMQMPSLVQGVGFVGDLISFNTEYFEAWATKSFFGEIGECPITMLGIEDEKFENNAISFYPNPASDFIYLDLSQDVFIDMNRITLYDLTGRVVIEWQKNEISEKLSIPQYLPNGIYFIEFNSDKESHSRKLQILRNN